MFRPEANAARFAASATRMAMPPLPERLFLESLRQLIEIDREWVPTTDEGSLYLRPFMFASEVFLGVQARLRVPLPRDRLAGRPVLRRRGQAGHRLGVATSTPGPRPAAPARPSAVATTPRRLAAQAEAIAHGCDQVVFLDAVQRRYVDELGGMNVFFVYDDGTLVTPQLTGTILPGITRDSVITLARHQGRTVEERPVSFDEWRADAASGRLREVFACGTAAVLTPIGKVRWPDGEFTDRLTAARARSPWRCAQQLVDIQRGRAADPFGWVQRVL